MQLPPEKEKDPSQKAPVGLPARRDKTSGRALRAESGVFHLVENTGKFGQRHAVIAHGHALLPGLFNARHHIGTVEHARPAVDDEIVRGEVGGKIRAAHHGDVQTFTEAGTQATGNFHPADILGKGRMGAGLGNEHTRMRRQAVDGFRPSDEFLDITNGDTAGLKIRRRKEWNLFNNNVYDSSH